MTEAVLESNPAGLGRYKPYPAYKDSGVEWLGNVPEHWETLALSRVTLSRCDGPFGSGLKSAHYSDCGVRVVRLQNIGWATFRDEDRAFVSADYARDLGTHDVQPSDLLVAGLGDERHPVGRACVAPEDIGPAMVKADCFRFRLDERWALPRFVAFQLSALADATAGSSATGSTRSRMNLTATSSRKVAMPPFEEQEVIARFIDRELAKIDAVVAKKEQLVELLLERRSAMVSHAVVCGIDQVGRERDSRRTPLDSVPVAWDVLPLTKFVIDKSDYRGKTPEKVHAGVFLVTARNVRMGFIDYECSQEYVAEDEYKEIMRRGLPKANDILFTTEAPLGNVALVDREDIALAQRIIRFRMDPRHFDSRFTLLAMMADHFQEQLLQLSTGSTAQGLKASKLSMLRLMAPPLDEQRKIGSYLEGAMAESDALIAKVRLAIDRLAELRAALISAAVTGQIDVRGEVA